MHKLDDVDVATVETKINRNHKLNDKKCSDNSKETKATCIKEATEKLYEKSSSN
ncbi:hypothetical protein KPL35_12740 [Clostridium sp. CF011]|uniref:hypothetical protein n=1 Tax=Clostridium sp. CF011 TaxID=2843318 RepID=UPI001C0D1970|nr:hypothetical protein [Clostridium sp. CF011]MBU3092940.1 hypothetical protein [Clostridium sp. CF011]WAG70871.1 hypothetical protein LL036_05405 [Clostridium sp. CF011]